MDEKKVRSRGEFSTISLPTPLVEIVEKVVSELKYWPTKTDFVREAVLEKLEKYNAYSIMVDPMTSCGCFECIAAVLPMCNGIMTVNRDFPGMTPCGMKFTTLAGSVGGGSVTPGFVGHSKHYICSKKFIMAEGGIKRLVWMPKMLKEDVMIGGEESGGIGFPGHIPERDGIAAGQPIPVPAADAWETPPEETLELPPGFIPGGTRVYALRVRGNSMVDAMIADGDLVLMEPVKRVNNGDVVAAWLKDEQEITLKKIYLVIYAAPSSW
jgi:hypothetical protein